MDENGLPITGAGVNYAAVEAINQRELITYFNAFVVRTCAFLNTFSTKCESKLADLHLRLETIDTSLTLLETKLNSIDELRDLKLENSENQQQQQQADTTAVSNTNSEVSGAPPPPPPPLPTDQTSSGAAASTASLPPPPPPPPPAPPVMTVSQDPRFEKYFKMLRVGIPEPAVRLKMQSEGLNPDLISTPDAPAPPPDSSDSEDD